MSDMNADMQLMINKLQANMEKLDPSFEAMYFDVEGSEAIDNNSHISNGLSLDQMIRGNFESGNKANVQESLTTVAAYAKVHLPELEDYLIIMELLEDPSNKELAQKTVDHYTEALSRLQNI